MTDDIDSWKRDKDYAIWANGFLARNEELFNTAPKTFKFITELAILNPVYAAATLWPTVYFTAVVAQQQLLKAKFKKDDLELIINTKITPLLELLGLRLQFGEVFNAKSKIQEQCENAQTSLQTIRKDIDQQMLDSVSGIGKNKVLQWLSVASGVGGIGAIVMMEKSRKVVAFGLSALVLGFVGVGVGYNNIKSYEDAMSRLEEAKLKVVEAETTFGKALTKADLFCDVYPSLPEGLESPEDLKRATDRFQLKKNDGKW